MLLGKFSFAENGHILKNDLSGHTAWEQAIKRSKQPHLTCTCLSSIHIHRTSDFVFMMKK